MGSLVIASLVRTPQRGCGASDSNTPNHRNNPSFFGAVEKRIPALAASVIMLL